MSLYQLIIPLHFAFLQAAINCLWIYWYDLIPWIIQQLLAGDDFISQLLDCIRLVVFVIEYFLSALEYLFSILPWQGYHTSVFKWKSGYVIRSTTFVFCRGHRRLQVTNFDIAIGYRDIIKTKEGYRVLIPVWILKKYLYLFLTFMYRVIVER